jgi:hypothetical protein
MNITESLEIFRDVSGLQLSKSEWSKVEDAFRIIVDEAEKEKAKSWNEGYECARDDFECLEV